MVTVETLVNRVLKQHTSFDLTFNQYARFLSTAIKENQFFIGFSEKWRAYWIISELMMRYYKKNKYPILKQELKKTLKISSPVSNKMTKDNPKVIKFRKEFDEMYDALKLKQELGESENKPSLI